MGDTSELMYASREKEYPFRLILSEEQADKLKKTTGVWETIKEGYIVKLSHNKNERNE